ncbi:MAG: helix-turn-helix domain-containing protein [Desulfobacterales bacterium]|nr:helix-turn-helix domain-containing protein [Desulfobacterales bacterium]
MITKNEGMTFGSYLKSVRLQKSMTLEQISAETRIGTHMLNYIEEEDIAHLPESIFTKGFLKAYAEIVDVDPETVLNQYLIAVKNYKEQQKPVVSQKAYYLKLLGIGSLFIIVAIFIGIVVFFYYQSVLMNKENVKTPEQQQEEPIQNNETSSDPTETKSVFSINDIRPSTVTEPLSTETNSKLKLEVKCIENSWIKIGIDGQDSNKYTMVAGDKMEFIASHHYNLLISNAKGISLIFNGKPYEIPAKQGQIINLELK